jgi:hypothetical protein
MTSRRSPKPSPRRPDAGATGPATAPAGRYVRHDPAKARARRRYPIGSPPRRRPAGPTKVVRKQGVRIVGTPAAIEDFLDAREIDRRLADPANQHRIPWAELKARRGL